MLAAFHFTTSDWICVVGLLAIACFAGWRISRLESHVPARNFKEPRPFVPAGSQDFRVALRRYRGVSPAHLGREPVGFGDEVRQERRAA